MKWHATSVLPYAEAWSTPAAITDVTAWTALPPTPILNIQNAEARAVWSL
jgi:hypothetical protein